MDMPLLQLAPRSSVQREMQRLQAQPMVGEKALRGKRYEEVMNMPSHKWHRLFTELFTGDEHGEVHSAIDSPYKILGRKHRILFHGILAPIIGAWAAWNKGKDPASGAAAGAGHVVQDRTVSAVNKGVRRMRRTAENRLLGKGAAKALRKLRRFFK